MHDPKAIILRIVSMVENDQHIMNIMDLFIQVVEPHIAKVVMPILCHIELTQLIQNIPFNW